MASSTAANLQSVVDRRYDFVLLFDVIDGNPNGDPDAGNLPRLDAETMQGLVTDACIKRKIRDYVQSVKTNAGGNEPGYGIYIQIQGVLNRLHQNAYNAKGIKPDEAKNPDKVALARQYMCENFYDIRTFGAVMSTGINCGQVRGPVQLTFSRSIDPIVPQEIAIVRKAVTTEKEATEQGYIVGTRAQKSIVPYGLYRGYGFVNPLLASDTGFTYADLKLLFEALLGMFEMDRSAARGLMATRGLVVFEHESRLGNAPAHELFDLVKIEPRGAAEPARQFADYSGRIRFDGETPPGVVAYELPRDLAKMFGQ